MQSLNYLSILSLILILVLVLLERIPAGHACLEARVVQMDVHRAQHWGLGEHSLLVNQRQLQRILL